MGNSIIKAIQWAAKNPWTVAKACAVAGVAARAGSLAPDLVISLAHAGTSAAKRALDTKKAQTLRTPATQSSATRATA